MATETPGGTSSGRPQPILLVLLAVVVAAYLLMRLGTAGPSEPGATFPAAQDAGRDAQVDPAMLEVNLEALERERPSLEDTERNPFRFEARPSPSPALSSGRSGPVGPNEPGSGGAPPPPPLPPGPPPITVKFIGVLDRADGTRLAVFVDCTVGRRTSHAQEGGIVDGRYRLVKIGLESVVVEHLDGRGRSTLAQTGQECAGR